MQQHMQTCCGTMSNCPLSKESSFRQRTLWITWRRDGSITWLLILVKTGPLVIRPLRGVSQGG